MMSSGPGRATVDTERDLPGGRWALRLAGCWSIALGIVIAGVAVLAMSSAQVAVDPRAGLAIVVGGATLAIGGVAVWRGSQRVAAAMAAGYAGLLIWRQFTPPPDVIDPNTGAEIPVTPTLLLVVALLVHVAALAASRRAAGRP